MNDPAERLKSHADWLQDRADNPNTVAPGSTDPRSIVDSKRLGEIARDIREFVEDVEDEAKIAMRPPERVVKDGPWSGDITIWGSALWTWTDGGWQCQRNVKPNDIAS